jgi:hypothetical protein
MNCRSSLLKMSCCCLFEPQEGVIGILVVSGQERSTHIVMDFPGSHERVELQGIQPRIAHDKLTETTNKRNPKHLQFPNDFGASSQSSPVYSM